MRGLFLAVVLVFNPFLAVFSPVAEPPEAKSSPYIYRIRAGGCNGVVPTRQFTGFRVRGKAGIYTALHGVAGCTSIVASQDYGDGLKSTSLNVDVEVAQVDVSHDIALLSSSTLAGPSSDGLPLGRESDIRVDEDQLVVGYPGGLTTQFARHGKLTERKKLKDMISPQDPHYDDMVKRSSPKMDLMVYHMEFHIKPGDSGAPVLTPGGKVVGMADGGVDSGSNEMTWAIPLSDIHLISRDTAGDEYDHLTIVDPAKALGFSTAFPEQIKREVKPKEVSAQTVHSFSSRSVMWIGVSNGSETLENSTVIDVKYDGRRKRSYVAVDNEGTMPGAGAQEGSQRIRLAATTIDGVQYQQRDTSLCADVGPPMGELDALQQAIYDQLSMPMGSLSANYLGDDQINGLNAKHYLLEESIPLQVDQNGIASESVTSAEFWLWNDYMIQLNLVTAATYDDPAADQPVAVVMIFSMGFTDINAAQQITLPATCRSQTQAYATAIPTSRYATANSTPKITATIENVDVQHNVSRRGSNGMAVLLTFTTENAQGRTGIAAVAVYSDAGIPLKAYNDDYRAENGTLAAWETYTPPDMSSRYEGAEVFLPYEEINLIEGIHNLELVAYVADTVSGELLAVTDPIKFTVQHDIGAAEPWVGMDGSVSKDLKMVVAFVSAASEAEINALYYLDPSYLTEFYAGAALQLVEEDIDMLMTQGLYMDAYFDAERSYIRSIEQVGSSSVDVEYCEYWQNTFYDGNTSKVVDTLPIAATPQRITLEVIGDKLYIFNVEFHDDLTLCAP